jgi:hypothetical protein
MRNSIQRLALVLAVGLMSLAGPALAEPLRFFAMGDAPYSEWEFMQLEGLLADVGDAGPAFVIHVGDIKSGSSVCTDTYIARIAELFRGVPAPVAYTPGDNEWTDCGRTGGDPKQRLAALRRDFYGDPAVLRLATLGAVHPDPDYPENYWFSAGGALFVAVHVVGSDNGLNRNETDAETEWRARSAANRTLLKGAVKAAKGNGARALVMFLQANPLFGDRDEDNGFAPFLADLEWVLTAFPGFVLVIHGDTHHYVLDHPLTDPVSGEAELRLTRLEVPGSPLVDGVWVTFDPDADEPFSFSRSGAEISSQPGGP